MWVSICYVVVQYWIFSQISNHLLIYCEESGAHINYVYGLVNIYCTWKILLMLNT